MENSRMAHFILEYADTGDATGREACRADHIAYRKRLGERLALAGPVLDDAGTATGSVVILEAADRAEAERLALQDPYVANGVLQLASLRPFRIAAMKPLARLV